MGAMYQLTNTLDLLEKAFEACFKATGLQFRVEATGARLAEGWQADALVRLQAPGTDVQFIAEVKKTLTAATLAVALEKLKRLEKKTLLVADYVNPNMAERLKEMRVPFVDTVGNAYIHEPPLFVYIKGEGPPKVPKGTKRTRAFQPTGLKVLFALLCRPELVNANYREMAKVAGVALGTVGWVVADLKAPGFWLDMGKRGRRLVNKAKLLERWAVAYPEQLRPKLVMGKFAAPDPNWWQAVGAGEFDAYWGAEVAAARLTQYLRPEFVTVYVRDRAEEFIFRHRLKKDPRGDVEVLKAFWRPECDWVDREMTHPLLVYVDLLATGDARNMEAARIVYERYLVGLVRED